MGAFSHAGKRPKTDVRRRASQFSNRLTVRILVGVIAVVVLGATINLNPLVGAIVVGVGSTSFALYFAFKERKSILEESRKSELNDRARRL